MRIIKFGAVWCPSCLIMRPRWKQVMEKYPDIETIEYDYDLNEDEVTKWEIGRILPVCIILDKNNQEIVRLIGEKTKEQIVDIINSYIKE